MVKREAGEHQLDQTFSALADPTRRRLLEVLREGEKPVGDLAEPMAMSWPAVTKHLKVLESAGLVARRKEGRHHYLRLVASPLAEAEDWVTRYRIFWEESFDALERHFEDNLKQKTNKEK